LAFRKRVLHRGSAIGPHQHGHDDICYIISVRGSYILDGKIHDVVEGNVMLTRKDSTHALQQTSNEDLVIPVTYPKRAPATQ
jgi:quercetin dioxygenase-like cupin family protein